MTTKKLTTRELVDLPYLSLAQAAQLLQVSTEHMRRKARADDIPGLEVICGVYRVRTAELLKSSQ